MQSPNKASSPRKQRSRAQVIDEAAALVVHAHSIAAVPAVVQSFLNRANTPPLTGPCSDKCVKGIAVWIVDRHGDCLAGRNRNRKDK